MHIYTTYNIIYSINNRGILYDTYNTVTHICTQHIICYNIIIHIYTCLMQSLSNDTYESLLNDQFIKEHFTVITYGSLEEEREDRGYCPCCCSPPEE